MKNHMENEKNMEHDTEPRFLQESKRLKTAQRALILHTYGVQLQGFVTQVKHWF